MHVFQPYLSTRELYIAMPRVYCFEGNLNPSPDATLVLHVRVEEGAGPVRALQRGQPRPAVPHQGLDQGQQDVRLGRRFSRGKQSSPLPSCSLSM